jgi:hypothetical protein
MKPLVVVALLGIAALPQMSAEAATPYHPFRQIYNGPTAPRICSPGFSWQYGCVRWELHANVRFCMREGWSCVRTRHK